MDYQTLIDRILTEKSLVVALEDLYENSNHKDLMQIKTILTEQLRQLHSNIEDRLSHNDEIFAHLKDYITNTGRQLHMEVTELEVIEQLIEKSYSSDHRGDTQVDRGNNLPHKNLYKNSSNLPMNDKNPDLNLYIYEQLLDVVDKLGKSIRDPDVAKADIGMLIGDFLRVLTAATSLDICDKGTIEGIIGIDVDDNTASVVDRCLYNFMVVAIQSNSLTTNLKLLVAMAGLGYDRSTLFIAEDASHDFSDVINLIVNETYQPVGGYQDLNNTIYNIVGILYETVVSGIGINMSEDIDRLANDSSLLDALTKSKLDESLKNNLTHLLLSHKNKFQTASLKRRLSAVFDINRDPLDWTNSRFLNNSDIRVLDSLRAEFGLENFSKTVLDILNNYITDLDMFKEPTECVLAATHCYILICYYEVHASNPRDSGSLNLVSVLSTSILNQFKNTNELRILRLFASAFDYFNLAIDYLSHNTSMKERFVKNVLKIDVPQLKYIRYRKRFPSLFDFKFTELDMMYQQIDRKRLR